MSDFYKAYWEHVMPKVTTYPSASTTTLVYHDICGHCGGNHLTDRCPYVKAIEYHENGQVKRIEFYPRPPDARPLTMLAVDDKLRVSDRRRGAARRRGVCGMQRKGEL